MTKQGYQQTEVGLIPEDWSVKRFDEFGKFFKGKGIKKDEVRYEGNPCVRYGELYTRYDNVIKKTSSFINNEVAERSIKLKTGDLLFAGSGETKEDIGKSAVIMRDDAYAGGDIVVFRAKNIDPVFLGFMSNSIPVSKQKAINGQGDAVVHIYAGGISKIQIPLPPTLTEQKAIATALSDVDALISSLELLITKKKAIKQGVMQQLLTPPHIGGKRLPGFSGEWVENNIESLVEDNGLIRGPFGGALKKEFFVQNGYKVYEQKNAIYKSVELGKYFIDNNKFKELNRFEILENDFILSCSGTIGKLYQIPKRFQRGIINQALLIIRIDNSVSDYLYFKYQFTSDTVQKNVIDDTQGGAMKNLIGMSDFKKATISYPPTLDEQKAIAQILSDIDKELNVLETKKAKSQAIKQGMMQELLTGKTRLV